MRNIFYTNLFLLSQSALFASD